MPVPSIDLETKEQGKTLLLPPHNYSLRRVGSELNVAFGTAHLYSLIETEKANGLNEYAYLKLVFAELPSADDAKAVAALLPWNVDPMDIDKQLTKPGSTR